MLQQPANVLQLHEYMQQSLVYTLQINLILLQQPEIMLQINSSAPPTLLARGSREVEVLQIKVYLQHPLFSMERIEAVLLQVKSFLLQIKRSRKPGKRGLLHISRWRRLRPE